MSMDDMRDDDLGRETERQEQREMADPAYPTYWRNLTQEPRSLEQKLLELAASDLEPLINYDALTWEEHWPAPWHCSLCKVGHAEQIFHGYGSHVGRSTRQGKYVSAGLPGTGLYFVHHMDGHVKHHQQGAAAWLLVALSILTLIILIGRIKG